MLLTTKVKVTSSWLGSERTVQQVRRFERDSHTKKLKLDLAQWNWAVNQAVESLCMSDVDVSAIRFPVHLDPPSLELLVRRWSHLNKGEQKESFESIRAGTHLTFDVLLASSREPAAGTGGKNDARPPTRAEYEKIMKFIGEHVGLSPWGNRMGYGRFELLEVKDAAA